MKTTTTILVALAVVSVSLAQRPGGGGPGGRMMMGGGAGSEAMLLARPDVQKDLKLTDEQKTKLQALQQEMQEKMRSMFGGMRRQEGGGGQAATPPPPSGDGTPGVARTRFEGNPEDMRAQMEAVQKEVAEKVKTIITAEQWARLGQIKVQIAGPRVVIDDQELAKKVGVKGSQKLEINKLLEAQQQANMQIFMRMRDQGADREALMKEITKNDQILREEIKKILTADQLKALADLEGPKFEADPNYAPRGFGGGPGGGRGGRGGG